MRLSGGAGGGGVSFQSGAGMTRGGRVDISSADSTLHSGVLRMETGSSRGDSGQVTVSAGASLAAQGGSIDAVAGAGLSAGSTASVVAGASKGGAGGSVAVSAGAAGIGGALIVAGGSAAATQPGGRTSITSGAGQSSGTIAVMSLPVDGTSTPPYFGESLSDLPGTPVRRTEAADASGIKHLDPVLAVLTAVAHTLPADRHRTPAPPPSRKRTHSDTSLIGPLQDLLSLQQKPMGSSQPEMLLSLA